MWTYRLYLTAISLHSVPTSAFTSFDTNCTLPTASYNYVAAPNVRSTLDITWTSLATIIACTFTVLHLNVPEQRDGRDTGWTANVKWWWKGFQPTMEWTIIAILAPEWYALNAISAYCDARMTRSFLRSSENGSSLHRWTLEHAFYVSMGGYAIRLPEKDTSKVPQSITDRRGDIVHLGARSFCQMSRRGLLESDCLLSDEDIADRSKSDALAKSLAVIQVLYFCTNCIVRASKQLVISPLEFGTLGFALCSFISYGCLFNKPRSVKTAVVLNASVFDQDLHIRRYLEDERADRGAESLKATIPNDNVHIARTRMIVPPLALAFGAIHFAAWNFSFPTILEQWLWRVCVVCSTAIPPLGFYIGLIPGVTRLPGFGLWGAVDESSVPYASFGLYSLARGIMIVLMGRCLFYLPPESFTNTWAANLPHV